MKPPLHGKSLNKASTKRESEAFLGKEVFFEGQEGEKVHGYLSKPYGDGPFPAIVLVYGGFSSDKATKSMVLRAGIFFYERDYVSLAVDYSKSEFGGKEVDDVLSGIDYLKSLEYVSKIGLFGSSHGGYISLMASTKKDVDAVVDCFGFTDLILMYEYVLSSEFHKDKENILLKMTEAYGGTPEEVPKVYREHSPLYHVEKINSPILFIHGMKDISVPWEQTKIFAETLEFHEKTYELFLFENASHGFIFKDTKEARDAWRKIFEFFRRYLREEFLWIEESF
ncbi:MAG: alpha/beta hydrolase family protein [Candidatus Methanofastidiosia archaeon]